MCVSFVGVPRSSVGTPYHVANGKNKNFENTVGIVGDVLFASSNRVTIP